MTELIKYGWMGGLFPFVSNIVSIISGIIIGIGILYFNNSPVYAVLVGASLGYTAWNSHIYTSQKSVLCGLFDYITLEEKKANFSSNENLLSKIFDLCARLGNDKLRRELNIFIFQDNSVESTEKITNELKRELSNARSTLVPYRLSCNFSSCIQRGYLAGIR